MKRVITLCLAMALSVGAAMAEKVVKDFNFEDGKADGFNKTKSTNILQVAKFKGGDGHTKGIKCDGVIYTGVFASKANAAMKLIVETKQLKGDNPVVISITQQNPETKKGGLIKKVEIKKSSAVEKTVVEFKSKYKGQMMVNVGTTDGLFILDSFKAVMVN